MERVLCTSGILTKVLLSVCVMVYFDYEEPIADEKGLQVRDRPEMGKDGDVYLEYAV